MIVPAGIVYVPAAFACVTDQPETSAPPATTLFTVTLTLTERPLLFAASYAFEINVCAPFAAPAVFQLHEYGAVVAVDCSAPSRRNSTFVTPTLSDALAVTFAVPETVAPFAGAVIAVVGAVVSPPPAWYVIHIGADQTSCPSACTAWT